MEQLMPIFQELWQSKWHTKKSFAVYLATYYTELVEEKELIFFKKWLDQCTGWDHTDGISGFVIAKMVGRKPKLKRIINSWTK